ncbi:SUMF1/EgtB/PvdO family nonheme iron enzyme [Prosthecobacter sp.]|uniref:SUMF1/EgtB/PvdO family nonheme iron enzyme n=1 Tax=Prosthecobacter sp. TaxID=1965333 RepID=UPI003782DC9A
MRLLLSSFLLAVVSLAAAEPPPGMVAIPAGRYAPAFGTDARARVVEAFLMDAAQVTNGQFLDFVKQHPEWRRSRVPRSLADPNYLSHWAGDLDLGSDRLRAAPVTHVSWFAARAYCAAHGRRLPTQDEWEFVARADATRPDASKDPAFVQQLLAWYSRPATSALDDVRGTPANVYGLRGLHGQVWEWVEDFNATMAGADSRSDGSPDPKLFCGAGSLLAADAGNYAAFMRYAFRSSLKGPYCVGTLGFRCAQSAHETPRAPAPSTLTTLDDLPGQWRAQDGRVVDLSSLRGTVRVLTMGFTRCRFSCPRILGDMQRIERELGAAADKVRFVFLSIDPEEDTPAQMSGVLRDRHMNPARWTFLSAEEKIVRQAAVLLDFKYSRVDGFFTHSNLIVALDESGRVIARHESLDADIRPVIEAVTRHLPQTSPPRP